ncbi:MAG: LysR family transcriptional regulator [Pseudomonadota bacterium]
MNLNQISAFRAVMNSASLSEAAEKLGRTQPAVSLAIRSLEDSLGIKLFERRGRQLVAVPEAHYLMAEASEILDRLSAVSVTMKSLVNGQAGTLNIASMPGPSTFLFPKFISEAVGDSKCVRISLATRTSMQIRELAATQSFDFGFADLLTEGPAAATIRQELITADCYCAMHKDHPLTEKDFVTCTDLDGLPLGSLQEKHAIHQRTVETLRQAGVTANMMVDSQYFLALLPFISSGRCLSIMDPLTMVTENRFNTTDGAVVFRPMKGFFRYNYVVLSPRYRPLSQLAQRVRERWLGEVIHLLDEGGARPQLEAMD